MDTFGERLRVVLERKRWRPSRLAAKLGVPASTVSRWLGDKSTPRSIYLTQIAQALDVSEELLLSGNGKLADMDSAARPADTEPGVAALLADEGTQRALGVYPISDRERELIGGVNLAGTCETIADALDLLFIVRRKRQARAT